jgi:hypothetical protein
MMMMTKTRVGIMPHWERRITINKFCASYILIHVVRLSVCLRRQFRVITRDVQGWWWFKYALIQQQRRVDFVTKVVSDEIPKLKWLFGHLQHYIKKWHDAIFSYPNFMLNIFLSLPINYKCQMFKHSIIM